MYHTQLDVLESKLKWQQIFPCRSTQRAARVSLTRPTHPVGTWYPLSTLTFVLKKAFQLQLLLFPSPSQSVVLVAQWYRSPLTHHVLSGERMSLWLGMWLGILLWNNNWLKVFWPFSTFTVERLSSEPPLHPITFSSLKALCVVSYRSCYPILFIWVPYVCKYLVAALNQSLLECSMC